MHFVHFRAIIYFSSSFLWEHTVLGCVQCDKCDKVCKIQLTHRSVTWEPGGSLSPCFMTLLASWDFRQDQRQNMPDCPCSVRLQKKEVVFCQIATKILCSVGLLQTCSVLSYWYRVVCSNHMLWEKSFRISDWCRTIEILIGFWDRFSLPYINN